jgi:uncharacterized membrane protein
MCDCGTLSLNIQAMSVRLDLKAFAQLLLLCSEAMDVLETIARRTANAEADESLHYNVALPRAAQLSIALSGLRMEAMYSKTRIEALSDAIFAIAMTLLVLELKVPEGIAHDQLWAALRSQGESWLAFLITFFIAARYWMLQHNVIALTGKFPRQAMVLTFLFLGLVTILPFSSSLVGHYGSNPLAFFLYCLNQTAIGAALIAKLEYLRRRDNIPKSPEMQYVRFRLYSLTGVMALTGCAATFIPLRYVFILPAVILLVSRRFLPKAPAA